MRGWWRYHQLFADLLRARLLQEQPERLPELHRAAAAWSERHGLVDDAIRHALAAGETVWAARLLEQHFDALLWRSEDPTLHRWLQALPAELVSSRPRLCLAQTVVAGAAGDVDAIQPSLDAAERALADHRGEPEEPYEPSVGRANSLLANVPAAIALQRATVAHLQGDPEQTRAFAAQALAELDEGDRMLASVSGWYLAVADWLGGRLAAGQQTPAAWGYYYLGQVRIGEGRLGAALGTYRRALEGAREPGAPTLQIARLAHVGMAGVLYERGELDAAHRHITEGIRLCRQFAYTPPLATGLAILAWIRRAQGDPDGAASAMREAERVEPSAAAVGLLDPMPALRARLLLAQGEVADAARWAQERGLGVDDRLSYPREREYLVLARVLLAQGQPKRALELLERLHAEAATQGRTGSIIELRVLQALALEASGDQAEALGALAEALALGAPEGYVRLFVDEGPPMAALLRELLAGRRQERPAAAIAPRGYLARLAEAFQQAGLPVRPPVNRGGVVVPGLVEPLTGQELGLLP